MCGLYGYYCLRNDVKGLPHFIQVLGKRTSIRGTDATGIAYFLDGKLHIEKEGVDAYKFKFPLPEEVNICMGHVRKTTQGSEKKNFNNHPFRGKATNCQFALAHNGVITNELRLRQQYNLPNSKIETDTYVAVQLLESFGELNMENIKKMAEAIEGMFTFTIIDEFQRLWIIKNDNPISIAYFPNLGMYVYASTTEILMDACLSWSKTEAEIVDTFKEGEIYMSLQEPTKGTIIVLHPDGTVDTGEFKPKDKYSYSTYHWVNSSYYNYSSNKSSSNKSSSNKISDKESTAVKYTEEVFYQIILQDCNQLGIDQDTVDKLLDYGWSLFDIDQALKQGTLLEIIDEMEEYENFFEEDFSPAEDDVIIVEDSAKEVAGKKPIGFTVQNKQTKETAVATPPETKEETK